MARPSEYNFDFLKAYKGMNIIYALYTEKQGIKYIGYSKNVYERFYNHLRNHESETNTKKRNWIEKYKQEVKIELLSINPLNWQEEEIKYIKKYSDNDLLNICIGGKNNRKQKPFEKMTDEEHLLQANKDLKDLNKIYESKGKPKRFKLLTKTEIDVICKMNINKKCNNGLF